MIPSTPDQIVIGRQALTHLSAVLEVVAPQEGCALLLGHGAAVEPPTACPAAASWLLQRIWPCLNCWQPHDERVSRFAIDPREQLQAQKWARQHDLRVLGAAHSHPDGQPVPSATDLALTLGPTLMLILGGGTLGCWWVPEPDPRSGETGDVTPRPLAWRMES